MIFLLSSYFCLFGQCCHIGPRPHKQEGAALTGDSATRMLSSSLKCYFHFSCHRLQLHILKHLSLITKAIYVYYKNSDITEIWNSKCKKCLIFSLCPAPYHNRCELCSRSQCSRGLYVRVCVPTDVYIHLNKWDHVVYSILRL